MGHDLADHRLRPAHVRRGLANGQRAGQRQVFQHRPRGAGQLTPRPVTTVERQVNGMEELGEPFCPRLFPNHNNSFPAR
jgi:hypothetical protein